MEWRRKGICFVFSRKKYTGKTNISFLIVFDYTHPNHIYPFLFISEFELFMEIKEGKKRTKTKTEFQWLDANSFLNGWIENVQVLFSYTLYMYIQYIPLNVILCSFSIHCKFLLCISTSALVTSHSKYLLLCANTKASLLHSSASTILVHSIW